MKHVTNVFKLILYFFENHKYFENPKKDILRDESLDEREGNNDSGQESNDDEDEEEKQEEQLHIQYETFPNLINLRHSIYLKLILSADFDEAGHKLLKLKLKPG